MKREPALLLICAVVFLSGCLAGEGLGKPTIEGIGHEWGTVTHGTTEIYTEVQVKNPNPVGLPVKQMYCDFNVNGIEMGESASETIGTLPANTTTTVSLLTTIDNGKLPDWWIHHVQHDERSTVHLTGGVVFDLKV
ncbi:MAG: LEA type 2 family protein, partial [Thermoplasmatota archaeon]